MNRRSTILFSCALTLGLLTLFAFSSSAPRQSNIGFVDLDRAIHEYKKTKDITVQLEKEAQAQREISRQALEKLKIERNSLLNLDPKSIEFARLSRKLKLEEIRLREDNKARGMEINFRLHEHVQMVYKEIVQVVEGVARQKGLIAVFQITDAELVTEAKGDIQSMIAVRNTIWCDSSVDITDEVVKLLNR